MSSDSSDLDSLLKQLGQGDRRVLGDVLERFRARLGHMVRLRLDRRVHGRVDTSDVIQEAYVEATERLGDYLKTRRCRFTFGCAS